MPTWREEITRLQAVEARLALVLESVNGVVAKGNSVLDPDAVRRLILFAQDGVPRPITADMSAMRVATLHERVVAKMPIILFCPSVDHARPIMKNECKL